MKRALSFAPAAVWALTILLLGSIPSLTPPVDLPLDKLGHFAMFAVLGALLAWGLHRAGVRASLAWPLVFGALVGAIDELHQRSVPGRSSDVADFVADFAGCAIALWLTHHLLERREKRHRA